MLDDLQDPGQRHVVGSMLQLESETKVRLRTEVAARGLPIAENAAIRAEGDDIGASLAPMTWQQKMTRLVAGVGERYLPRYQELADTSDTDTEDTKITAFMVEHEKALLASLQLAADDRFAEAVTTLEPHLSYPLPAPPLIGKL